MANLSTRQNGLFRKCAGLADIRQPGLLRLARLADIRQPVLLGLARLSHICQMPFLKKNVTRLDTFARVIRHFREFGASGHCLVKLQIMTLLLIDLSGSK